MVVVEEEAGEEEEEEEERTAKGVWKLLEAEKGEAEREEGRAVRARVRSIVFVSLALTVGDEL